MCHYRLPGLVAALTRGGVAWLDDTSVHRRVDVADIALPSGDERRVSAVNGVTVPLTTISEEKVR
ncbi:hypothetical protein SAMN05421810_11412 [Amycolatopsis arida]|uniref:Uncharacterized protein n=1 Tax=Amycolatopsis arida TaxID=587909 RepID=A0A1I6AQJ4_9PSEU|nr:hypothetical protein CLV69_102715 [Amycolatopsis arida]SFQ70981.1 hypothetical protein SAMN05421810_11412 [Amycolatopsis arida]